MDRRTLLGGGAAMLAAGAGLAHAVPHKPAKSLQMSVEHLRKAMLGADEAALGELVSKDVSFGHSNGLIQVRDEFVSNLVKKVEVFHTLDFTDRDVHEYGDVAHERHKFKSDLSFNGKRFYVELDVLQVWHKEDGVWKLFARQAFKA